MEKAAWKEVHSQIQPTNATGLQAVPGLPSSQQHSKIS
jgi:hypothetical protein